MLEGFKQDLPAIARARRHRNDIRSASSFLRLRQVVSKLRLQHPSAMAGDDERTLSLRGLSARMDAMDGRFGTLETSLQGLHQAIEGTTLQLNNGNNSADGLCCAESKQATTNEGIPINAHQ